MIISDFSKVAYSAVHAFSGDIKKSSPEEIEGILRHVIINSFMSLKKKFGREYGELVIVLDGTKNFRYGLFPNYKAGRKKSRDEDSMPWHIIFDVLNRVREEAKMYWPWKVVWSEFAEADDCMAVLVEEVANLNITQVGLNMEPEPVILDTSDTDMFQLLKYENVKQWNSRERKFVKPVGMTPEQYLIDHIITGDGGDGIPNVFSEIDSFVNKKRQVAAIKSRVDPIKACRRIFDYKEKPEVARRIEENYKLICFDAIPLHIREDIIASWNSSSRKPKMTMLKYLNEKKCKELAKCVDEM